MNRFRSRILLVTPMCLLVLPAFLPGSAVYAATRMVSNCNDSGAGSLRNAVALAMSGDTIDLRSLACPRIVLNGQVDIPQQDLRLLGPGRFALSIDGNAMGRVFQHTGAGTLYIDRMSITNGRVEVPGPDYITGGCVQSLGVLRMVRSRVYSCRLWVDHRDINNSAALGGAVYAREAHLSYSSVAYSTAGYFGSGGGVYAGIVTLYRSQVYGNTALKAGGGVSGANITASYSLVHGNRATIGGGISGGPLTLNKTTVSANQATGPIDLGWISNRGGGVFSGGTGIRHYIVDSTFSGNVAPQYAAAYLAARSVMFNTTITENIDTGTRNSAGVVGCWEPGALWAYSVLLESTIVAGNRCEGGPGFDVANGTTIVGSHNLIGVADRVTLPSDTLSADPRLGPLTDNGGPVRTHLPTNGSPALDRGSNPHNRMYDQRGPGFPRVKGPAADIGSTER